MQVDTTTGGQTVEYTRDGPIGYITLNRPPANSYDYAFVEALGRQIEAAAADAEARAVILRSALGRFFSAEGVDLGILDRLFPADAVAEETRRYAEALAGGAVGAAGAIKLAVHRGMARPLDEGLAIERQLVEGLFRSEDAREGLTA